MGGKDDTRPLCYLLRDKSCFYEYLFSVLLLEQFKDLSTSFLLKKIPVFFSSRKGFQHATREIATVVLVQSKAKAKNCPKDTTSRQRNVSLLTKTRPKRLLWEQCKPFVPGGSKRPGRALCCVRHVHAESGAMQSEVLQTVLFKAAPTKLRNYSNNKHGMGRQNYEKARLSILFVCLLS